MLSDDYVAIRDQAVKAARLGGTAAMRWFQAHDLEVTLKDDQSPVTVADQAAEQTIRDSILSQCPDDSWIGEETGTLDGTSDYNWICDPIDGTKNFIRGIPLWATLVACEHKTAGVIAAAVYIPALDEMYEAYKGGGARWNGTQIRVSEIQNLEQSLFCFETMEWFENFGLLDVFTS
ncbi:MAG: histidinol phosphate phosphatase, partial [Planctomycetes bacterium]|nr:histidinol phosphate phosphatase [Planctomycetota bacterium]